MEGRFKIVMDGTYSGTRIFDPEGKEISTHIRSVLIKNTAGELPTALFEIVRPIVEVEIAEENVETKFGCDDSDFSSEEPDEKQIDHGKEENTKKN